MGPKARLTSMVSSTSVIGVLSSELPTARDVDAVLGPPQDRVEPMRSDDVHDLSRVGDHVRPAIGNAHLRKVLQDVEADTLKNHHASQFQACQIAELASRLLDRTGSCDKHLCARVHLALSEKLRESFYFEQRELRPGEHDEIGAAVLEIVAGVYASEIGIGYNDLVLWSIPAKSGFQARRFRCHADHVKHGHGAVAGEGATQVFELVGNGCPPHAMKDRNCIIILMLFADDLADCSPIGHIIQLCGETHADRSLPMPIEMKAVFRRSSGHRRSERRRSSLEV